MDPDGSHDCLDSCKLTQGRAPPSPSSLCAPQASLRVFPALPLVLTRHQLPSCSPSYSDFVSLKPPALGTPSLAENKNTALFPSIQPMFCLHTCAPCLPHSSSRNPLAPMAALSSTTGIPQIGDVNQGKNVTSSYS